MFTYISYPGAEPEISTWGGVHHPEFSRGDLPYAGRESGDLCEGHRPPEANGFY